MHCAQEQHTVLAGGTLHVMYVSPTSYMHIDIATVRALELIKPMKAPTQGSRGGSLFWWLNHTKTRCGTQLLKACPWQLTCGSIPCLCHGTSQPAFNAVNYCMLGFKHARWSFACHVAAGEFVAASDRHRHHPAAL